MNKEKMIAKTAKKLADLEKLMYEVDDIQSVQERIDNLVNKIDPEDMLAIDDYIYEHNLLIK